MTDDRELPTAPENLRPSQPPPMTEIPPSARLPTLRPDPDSYSHWALSQLLARVRGLESDRGAMSMADFEAALERNTKQINSEADRRSERAKEETRRNFEITNHEVQRLATKLGEVEEIVRELPPRLGKVEERLQEGDELFEALRLELAAMKSQMAGFEKLYARLDRLEQELALLRPPRHEPPHGG